MSHSAAESSSKLTTEELTHYNGFWIPMYVFMGLIPIVFVCVAVYSVWRDRRAAETCDLEAVNAHYAQYWFSGRGGEQQQQQQQPRGADGRRPSAFFPRSAGPPIAPPPGRPLPPVPHPSPPSWYVRKQSAMVPQSYGSVGQLGLPQGPQQQQQQQGQFWPMRPGGAPGATRDPGPTDYSEMAQTRYPQPAGAGRGAWSREDGQSEKFGEVAWV